MSNSSKTSTLHFCRVGRLMLAASRSANGRWEEPVGHDLPRLWFRRVATDSFSGCTLRIGAWMTSVVWLSAGADA